MVRPIFGTAHLYGLVPQAASDRLLAQVPAAGFGWLDTAPSYGFGRSEAAVGHVLSRTDPRPGVTTKVGIAPGEPPSQAKRWAKAAARRLPAGVQDRLRGSSAPGHGRFAVPEVRASIETSLQRLGTVDRLLLHEVQPDDISDELLTLLAGYADRIGQFGVATANGRTAGSIARAPELLTCAHLAVGPLAAPVSLPDTVTTRVGHGLLGNGASELHRLQARLAGDPALSDRWRTTTEGTRWAGSNGLADALIGRAATLGLTDVIVATSQPAKLEPLLTALAEPVPEAILAVIGDLAAQEAGAREAG